MYTPPFNDVHDALEIRAMVRACRTGWLVTVGADGTPVATLLPVMWEGDRVIAHMARANPQWMQIGAGTAALLIVTGCEAYVSPSWYAAKAEHGKVVPTWNYTAVHLTGTVTVHDDPAWLCVAVTELTALHEADREGPWHVTDAPEQYIEGQLRGIVGVEMIVTGVEGKAKLSQNRSDADRRGAVDGIRADVADDRLDAPSAVRAGDIADRMAETLDGDHGDHGAEVEDRVRQRQAEPGRGGRPDE